MYNRSPPLTSSSSVPSDLSRSHSSPSPFYSKLLQCASPPPKHFPSSSHRSSSLHGFWGEDPVVTSLLPSVTVVLEGRSICQRINLHKHGSYSSLAKALRQMFRCGIDDVIPASATSGDDVEEVELGNAVPGYLVAYEDLENDLLLAGDLSWNDFVRVAKRIRILPLKPKYKKPTTVLKQAN